MSTEEQHKYSPEMTDQQVIDYCNEHLKGVTVDLVNDPSDLNALIRLGEIMANSRKTAESQGRAAKLRLVQNKITTLEHRYALASIIGDLAHRNLSKTVAGQVPEMEFEIVFKVAGRELQVSYNSIAADHAPGQQQLGIFSKAIQDIAKIVTSGCQRQYHVVNNGSGEYFGLLFDFQTPKADILAEKML